jgi:hypothetical protein
MEGAFRGDNRRLNFGRRVSIVPTPSAWKCPLPEAKGYSSFSSRRRKGKACPQFQEGRR